MTNTTPQTKKRVVRKNALQCRVYILNTNLRSSFHSIIKHQFRDHTQFHDNKDSDEDERWGEDKDDGSGAD